MKCRNCSHPFRIRTNPQERGFDFVEGVKIQAGQEPSTELLESTIATNMKDGLKSLDQAAQSKHLRKTELEELQSLQKLNQASMLNDAFSNANVRSKFRKDRKQKRARMQQATNLGWRQGMQVVGPCLNDAVEAKETVFGKPKATEQERFKTLKKSSIFSTNKTSNKRRKKTNIQEIEERATELPPTVVSSSFSATSTEPSRHASESSTIPRKIKKIKIGHLSTKNQSSVTADKALPAASCSLFKMYGSDTDDE